MIETDALSVMIADAAQVPVVVTPTPAIDLTAVPRPRAEVRIPESTAVLLLDYELYVS